MAVKSNKTAVKNKNVDLVDESESIRVPLVTQGIQYSQEESDILLFLKERYDEMSRKKTLLNINYKCDLYDRLYTPHRLMKLQDYDKELERAVMSVDDDGRKANKSKPIAFEKVQTALAIMIKENPKAFMKAYGNKWKSFNEIVKAAYEYNWDSNRLNNSLKRFTFHLAKYGIAYGRRYIKKEYKIIHTEDGKKERVVKFFDTVFEPIHPKNILLDEQCLNPREARDLFIISNLTLNQLKDMYPEAEYPRIKFVNRGRWLTDSDKSFMNFDNKQTVDPLGKTYEHLIYENEYKDIRLIIVNGVLISGTDDELPGHQLSIFGEKWAEKDETYDGIGVCEVLENYAPLVDDIANADIDLVREVIRPKLYMGAGVTVSDEESTTVEGQQIIKFNGDLNQLKYDRPTRTGDATQILEFLNQEIDDATGIAKDLASTSEAKTLGQATFNRENSLRRLSLPLDALKNALEDDANKCLPLLKIVNSSPLSTYEIEDKQEELEAIAILKLNPKDERFVRMEDGKLARRQFREMEVPVQYDEQAKMFNPADQLSFWEIIPSTFDWKGKINIIPMSFIGESEAMQVEAAMQDMNILMGIQDMDQMGMPVLVDENGKPFKINKVKVIKDYLKTRRKDPDEYMLEMNMMNIAGNNEPKPLTNPANLQPTGNEKAGRQA